MRQVPKIHPRVLDDPNSINPPLVRLPPTVSRGQNDVIVDIDKVFNEMLAPDNRETREINFYELNKEHTSTSYKMEDTMPIVWLDPDANDDPTNNVVQNQLKGLTKSFTVFITGEECEEHIRELGIGEQILLIIAGSIGIDIIPVVHDSTQVNVIFMYARKKKYYEDKLRKKTYIKVKEVINDPTTLIKKIREEQDMYRQVDDKEISVNIYNSNEKLKGGNLSDANWRFMWMYSFMDVLLRISPSLPSSIANIEKNQLVKILQTLFFDNENAMREIQKFEKHYSSDKAITWYTSESPLYRVLNRALRERDLKLLLSFRFFIFDIYKQLLHEYENSNRTTLPSIVYRAQFMPSYTVLRMTGSIGGYVSMNSFLSTTLNRRVALEFVGKLKDNLQKDLHAVLFEIQIDPSIKTLPYANISQYSMFSAEEEVLFSPGIILKIQDIVNDNTDNNLCIMRLKLCGENEEGLDDIVPSWKTSIESQTDLTSFGWLLMQTDQLKCVKNFYKMLLKNITDNELLIGDCYQGLGNVYLKQNEFTKAIDCHKHAVNTSENMANDKKRLAKGYSYLADAYKANGENESALKYYEKALKKFEKVYTKAHRDTIECYKNMGSIYQKQKKYDQALNSLKIALKLNEEIDINDPHNLIEILRSLSQIHCFKSQFSDALTYLRRSLKICQKTLKTNDPETGTLHEDIGDIHLKRKEFLFALSSYHKAAEIYYFCYTQLDQHNLDIQRIIKYCNIELRKHDNTIRSHQPLVTTNANQSVPPLNQTINRNIQHQPSTTISIDGRTTQFEPIQHNRHIPSPVESLIAEDFIPLSESTNTPHSYKRKRDNVIEQGLNINQRTLD